MALEGGLNDRKREEVEDKATGRHCFENPASTLTCAARMGRLGGEGRGPLNDILQRNQTFGECDLENHTLLKSPLVSHNKSIFTGDLQAVDHTRTHTEEMYLQNTNVVWKCFWTFSFLFTFHYSECSHVLFFSLNV